MGYDTTQISSLNRKSKYLDFCEMLNVPGTQNLVLIESLNLFNIIYLCESQARCKSAEMRKYIILEIYLSFSDLKIEIKDYSYSNIAT